MVAAAVVAAAAARARGGGRGLELVRSPLLLGATATDAHALE